MTMSATSPSVRLRSLARWPRIASMLTGPSGTLQSCTKRAGSVKNRRHVGSTAAAHATARSHPRPFMST